MTEAFQTLQNGVLLDYLLDEKTGRITLRAGSSLEPTERAVVLQLEPVEQLELINNLIALYSVRTGVGVVVRPSTGVVEVIPSRFADHALPHDT